jgi:MerR family transcriptional regulator, light-induced transcriptional regulator
MDPTAAPDDGSGFGIGELAERTGVPQATLRTWESRYGVPRPRRLPGGHRRYTDRDVSLVADVLRLRDSGLALPAAVAAAGRSAEAEETSVFAGLRRRHPDLIAQTLSKPSLLALSRAIEDECCARAEQATLFAAFQRERFYRASAARWSDLARTARSAVVFADFGRSDGTASPVQVDLPPSAPLRREWVLVCDSADLPACVAAWELPGQEAVPDTRRRFESVWSVDARVVRDAARICAGLAGEWGDVPGGPTPRPSADLLRAQSLFHRFVEHLDGAGG